MAVLRRQLRRDSGAAAVEFALVLPLMLLLIFMLLDFGRFFFCQVSLTSASRDAARAAALRMTSAQVATIAANSAVGVVGMSMSGSSFTSTVLNPCGPASTSLDQVTTVTLTQPFKWLMPVGVLRLFDAKATTTSITTITAHGAMLCT